MILMPSKASDRRRIRLSYLRRKRGTKAECHTGRGVDVFCAATSGDLHSLSTTMLMGLARRFSARTVAIGIYHEVCFSNWHGDCCAFSGALDCDRADCNAGSPVPGDAHHEAGCWRL